MRDHDTTDELDVTTWLAGTDPPPDVRDPRVTADLPDLEDRP